ncbi:MAG: hypothetical protein OXU83_00245, partial [Gammaproteobacteria bacterium]|nr:hypothetical protein [Gammaproteobacteria bacterium]
MKSPLKRWMLKPPARRACVLVCVLAAVLLSGCARMLPFAAPAAPAASEHGVSEFVLDNGMKVLVYEDHRAP